jgi:hypothetical protein
MINISNMGTRWNYFYLAQSDMFRGKAIKYKKYMIVYLIRMVGI